jgi:hypothetical protein
MNKRILLIVGLLVVAATAYYAYREWNREPEKAAEASAEVALPAMELFQAFTTDEVAAGARFNDKLVQVNGTVREVNGGGQLEITLSRGLATPDVLHKADSTFRLLGAESVQLTDTEVIVSFPMRIGRTVEQILEATTLKSVKSSEKPAPLNVLLETGDPLGAVVCEFEAGAAPTVKKDDKVAVKGYCAGYNLDVLLQRCAIVE